MKKIRIISALLSLCMIIGVLANLYILPAFAANTDDESSSAVIRDGEYYRENYVEKSYASAELKIKTMNKGVPLLTNDKYEFYLDTLSGEWALKNVKTGQYIFSNPYDLGGSKASEKIKMDLLSQILITYDESGVEKSYTSFEHCVKLNQLKVRNLKNGIRVEYAIGNEETRRLLPIQITEERFQSEIMSKIPDEIDGKTNRLKLQMQDSMYILKDPNQPGLPQTVIDKMLDEYPICEKYPIRVLSADAKDQEKNRMETQIKTYCPGYTFEELEYDHTLVGYVAKDKAPAVFKFGLEYSLTDEGIDVRLGANGIRFDETVYTLKNMKILPYVGAGSSDNTGYIFIPDGSGTIIRFEDVITDPVALSGKLYGQDYAFHDIKGSTQQTMRLPVYGVVSNGTRNEVTEVDGNVVINKIPQSGGFLAIITEGESLANIHAETGGTLHKYNTAYTSFNPRPSDQYNLSDSISVGSNASWTVVSDRKYTGSYRIKYVMLEDELLSAAAAEKEENYNGYEASYVGMAKAYRDYLYGEGQLNKLTEKDVKENIPLYIETLGTIDTVEKILSFPVTVETPLTTFDDLMTMYSELQGMGVDNVNFRLKGFANGGLSATVPSQVKFQKKAGGDSGYKELLAKAESNGFGVYPDFDFSYVYNTGMFDGFSFKGDAVRTIDDRYTQKQKYNNVYQTLMETGNVVISVSAFSEFYEGMNKDLKKLGATSLSVSTLGSDLNSDFDEDNPYNREDARYETVKLLKSLNKDYTSIMSDAGNAYVLSYVDHLLNVSLDSSRYIYSSQAVPFMGMVLHGAVEFTGTPLNTTGNIAYEMLKMIENGSNPYFLLAYRNTAELKDDAIYADYFSVRYDIWKEDLVNYYKTLNEALKDVQTSVIVDHEFIQASRVPTEQEKLDDEAALKAAEEEEAINKVHVEEKERRAEILAAKLEALKNAEQAPADPDATEPGATPENPGTEDTEEDEPAEEDPAQNPSVGEQNPEPEDEEDLIDIKTKYLTQTGTVVKVTYANGTVFILNYNSFDIVVNDRVIEAFGFLKSTVEEEEKYVEVEPETPAVPEQTEPTEPEATTEPTETTDPAETISPAETTTPAETTATPAETTEPTETTGTPAVTGEPATAETTASADQA